MVVVVVVVVVVMVVVGKVLKVMAFGGDKDGSVD